MSDAFKNGGSHLEGDWAYSNYTKASGQVGYGPDAHDEKGSCYWADKDNMDPIWQYHDSNIAEHELGFNEGDLNGQYRYRVDCDDLSSYNQRVATGLEAGANDNFTGVARDNNGDPIRDENGKALIDPETYNKRTSGGQPECVTDQIPLHECSVTGPQRFDDPNELTDAHCNKADMIASMPEGDARNAKLDKWNSEANALNDRMSGEQEYLQGRIADHEKRMSEFPEGSLEYNRALDNRNWCQNYSDELAASQEKLQEKSNALNSSNEQIAGQLPKETPSQEAPTEVAGQQPSVPAPTNQGAETQIAGATPDKKQNLVLSDQENQPQSTGKELAADAGKNTASSIDASTGMT